MELFELFAKMGLDTKDFEENIKQSSDKGKSFGAAFGEVAADIGRAALEIGKAAAGMAVEIGKAAFAVGADFEAEMTNLQAITGMTADEMNMMGDGIRNIALETGKSVIEVAANAKMVAEAGGDMNLMMSQLEHGTNLAMASQTDLATTLDFLGSSMKTFGVEAEDTQGVVDSFALVTSLANTTLSDLSYAYTNAGGEASNAGLSIDDVNAILITFANAGLKGGAAGTSLNAVLRNLSTPTDKAAGALDDLNVALYDAEGATRDVFDVMSDLESALSGLTDEEKNQYESVIFDTVALKGWNMIASEGIDAIAELSGELSDSAEAFDGLGQAAGMAGVATDNFKGTVDHFNAALADAGISIFENFKGPIEAVIESATGIVTAFAGIVTGVDGA
ncbi:MAG: phage tail tape measure protein, partial [Oscillospiraceae bacterium]|nr:phage tail tape measure protein [Oscillospiraceae bacterium]